MEVTYWSGGLIQHEVNAIEKIKNHFSVIKEPQKMIKGKSFEALKNTKPEKSIFPWKGYAGFRFVDSKQNYEGEFDLVIITHCNILIIELKHWNGEVTYSNDKWFQNGEDRGRSPVSITRNKKELLEKKLDRYKNEFSNNGFKPHVHFLIVMTGNANLSKLPENQLNHIINLSDFLELKNEYLFNKRFRPHPGSKVLNQDFHIFDRLFNTNDVKPKSFRINGYSVNDDAIFKHPKEIYQEFIAKSERIATDQALVRRWNFTKIKDSQAKTQDGRYRLISREYVVLEHLKVADEELYSDCLNHKRPPNKEQVTDDYAELFSILPSNKRLNQFIEQHAKQMNEEERLSIVQLLLNKFSRLHKAGIAHRDIGDHSIWISAAKKITLSGFISAYYPENGTIGNIRELLSVSGTQDLAEDSYPLNNKNAFVQDTRSLVVLFWHIIHAERLSKASLEKLPEQIKSNTNWYADIFRQALSEEYFSDAVELLDTFSKKMPEKLINFSFDLQSLEPYFRDINHGRHYREDNDDSFIISNSDKEVYISNGLLVKAWLDIQYQNDSSMARNLYHFLGKIGQLKHLSLDYLPPIRDFGIAKKSNSLYLVCDFIQGLSWTELTVADITLDEKFEVIQNLVATIQHLHGINFAHGDLHPENIKLTRDENQKFSLFLLDILDYTASAKSNLNFKYSPPSAEMATEIERDNFAVMRLSYELLGQVWGEPSIDFPEVSKVLTHELSDKKTGFISLERFKDALKPKIETTFIDVTGKFDQEMNIKIYPENGELFIKFEQGKHNKSKVHTRFMGIGGSFDIIIDPKNFRIENAFAPRASNEIFRRQKESSNLSVFFGLNITGTRHFDFNNLQSQLNNNNIFKQALTNYWEQVNVTKTNTSPELQVAIEHPKTNNDVIEENIPLPDVTEEFSIEVTPSSIINRPSIRSLWDAILHTEIEALPCVTAICEDKKDANGKEKRSPKIEHDESTERYYLYYEVETDSQILDYFRKDDVVEAIGRDIIKNKDIKLGKINIQHSSSNRLCFNKEPKNTRVLLQSQTIYLQSKQSEASFKRRKKALQRILDGGSVIKNLPEYFDENCSLPAIAYDIPITDNDFKRYDRDNVSLNDAQRNAFKRLLQNGPLSLLQGPPGTGKTEFIAAFVHFLFEKQNVKNILLVSQSHEAVNTAAERIRRHCQRLETDIDIVRFSNRESAISSELLDVFSQNLITAKREILQATKIQRIAKMGHSLGIQSEYLQKRAEIQLEIGSQVERLDRLESNHSVKDEDIEDHNTLCKKITQYIFDSAKNTGLISSIENLNTNEIMPYLINYLDNYYGIQPKESTQANELITLTSSMLEALSNEKVSYDEFLARSRHLVVGTCVGIGQSHIGIADNVYDWVIIDEAARSISSELAIAMQSGTRVLLVGDHKQLPPLYSKEHKNALARHLGITSQEEEFEQILSSDFERVFESKYGEQTCATLQTQYRMAPAIGSLISQCFYEGKLKNGKQDKDVPDIYNSLSNQIQSSVTWLDTTNLPNAYHIKHNNGSLTNQAEADLIIKLLQDFSSDQQFYNSQVITECLEKGEAAIGIICMYGEQKRLIRKKFNEREWSENFKKLVKIDTVDSYQGKENHIIILSITRNDKKYTTGFLKLPNRINVALSRAMDKLVIIGTTNLWRGRNANFPLGHILKIIENSTNKKAYSIIKTEPINANAKNQGQNNE